MSVIDLYRSKLAARGYRPDEAQLAAVARLQRLEDEFVVFKRARSNRFKRLIHRPELPRGVWMWGGVGRGKSFLMDCLYEAIPVVRKTRVHFHEFMRSVHLELDRLKGTADPLDEVGRAVARKYRLICFDEFHVSDIADAMILERLLRSLFANGVSFVMTSNYAPSELYPDGLHRDRILPAIALLQQHLDVLCVDAGTDYRRRELERIDTFLVAPPPAPEAEPDWRDTDARLGAAFQRIAECADEDPWLLVGHRDLKAQRRAGGVAWFDFATLCGSPRSQNDYLELATLFHTVVVSRVPEMGPARHSEARRFTWLVDVLYDLRVKLLVSAAAEPEQLYPAGRMANEFARTVSRLIEMQSREYLDAPRRVPSEALACAAAVPSDVADADGEGVGAIAR